MVTLSPGCVTTFFATLATGAEGTASIFAGSAAACAAAARIIQPIITSLPPVRDCITELRQMAQAQRPLIAAFQTKPPDVSDHPISDSL